MKEDWTLEVTLEEHWQTKSKASSEQETLKCL